MYKGWNDFKRQDCLYKIYEKKHETHPCPEKNIGYKPCLSRILYQYNDMKIYRCSNIFINYQYNQKCRADLKFKTDSPTWKMDWRWIRFLHQKKGKQLYLTPIDNCNQLYMYVYEGHVYHINLLWHK